MGLHALIIFLFHVSVVLSGGIPRKIANITTLYDAGPTCTNQTLTCETVLRLSLPQSNSKGAVWYQIPLNLNAGFNVTFTFYLSDFSETCSNSKDYKDCSYRGANGLAYVIQNAPQPFQQFGLDGPGLGYDGINNSIAIEFDSWYDPEMDDPWDNHLGIHSNARGTNRAHHSTALAFSPIDEDYCLGTPVTARIVFHPDLQLTEWRDLTCGTFSDPPTSSSVTVDASIPPLPDPDEMMTQPGCNRLQMPSQYNYLVQSGQVAFEEFGFFAVYVNDMTNPKLATPLTPRSILNLINGTSAYMGFTSTTGNGVWQAHDILSWQMCSTAENVCRTVI